MFERVGTEHLVEFIVVEWKGVAIRAGVILVAVANLCVLDRLRIDVDRLNRSDPADQIPSAKVAGVAANLQNRIIWRDLLEPAGDRVSSTGAKTRPSSAWLEGYLLGYPEPSRFPVSAKSGLVGITHDASQVDGKVACRFSRLGEGLEPSRRLCIREQPEPVVERRTGECAQAQWDSISERA